MPYRAETPPNSSSFAIPPSPPLGRGAWFVVHSMHICSSRTVLRDFFQHPLARHHRGGTDLVVVVFPLWSDSRIPCVSSQFGSGFCIFRIGLDLSGDPVGLRDIAMSCERSWSFLFSSLLGHPRSSSSWSSSSGDIQRERECLQRGFVDVGANPNPTQPQRQFTRRVPNILPVITPIGLSALSFCLNN
jgi:hypothetical protein